MKHASAHHPNSENNHNYQYFMRLNHQRLIVPPRHSNSIEVGHFKTGYFQFDNQHFHSGSAQSFHISCLRFISSSHRCNRSGHY